MLKKKKAPGPTAARGTATQKETGSKQTKNELRLVGELRLKNIVFETSAAANSTADNQGNINHVNAAFLRLWGYRTEEEAVGKSVASFFADQKDALPVMEALKTTGQWEGEFLAKRTDGTTFITRGSATVIRDESGKQIGYHSSNIDVTGERRAQEELREKNEEMEAANQELSAANEELTASEEELKAAEEELHVQMLELEKSEQKFHDTVKYLDEGYYSCNIDGLVLDHNRAFNQILGIDIDQDMKGKKLPDFWQNPGDRKEYLSKLMNEGSIRNFQINAKTISGKKVFVMASAHIVKDDGGQPVRIEGTFNDFTERVRAEQELKTSEERFRTAAESITDVVYEWDLKEKLVWYGNIDGLMGYPANGFPRTLAGWIATLHPEDVDNVGKAIEGQLKGAKPYAVEYRIRKKDGEWRWWSARGTALRDGRGEPYKWVGAITDITERKLAEQALRESKVQLEQRVIERTQELQAVNQEMTAINEELNASNEEITAANEELQAVQEELQKQREEQRVILDSVPAWVFYKNKENRFIRVNQAFADVMGISKEQLEGKSLSDFYPREQADAFWNDDLKVITSGQPKRNIIESMDSPKGTLWVQTDKIPYRDAQGNIIGIIGFTIDITELKKAEDLIQQRTTSLEASNQELESFAYSVSHDLRTPLRAIDGFSKIVIEDYGDKLDDEGRRLLKVVRDNTSKMSKLIDDLLTYSRIGRQEATTGTVNMAALARSVVDEIEQANTGRQVSMTIGKLPPAAGDSALLRQALINLVSNSFKFTKPKPDAEIEIGFTTEAGVTWYFVKDNGAGFDMRYAGKLFGVFQRLHSQEEFEGTGVGLAIVQRVIHKHGGKIRGEGEVGKGAAFYFTLPG
jgi:PAS domain S-box-containing protein